MCSPFMKGAGGILPPGVLGFLTYATVSFLKRDRVIHTQGILSLLFFVMGLFLATHPSWAQGPGGSLRGNPIDGDPAVEKQMVYELTLGQHLAYLKKRESEIRAEINQRRGKNRAQIKTLQLELYEIQSKQVDLKNSLDDQIQLLKDTHTDLQKFEKQFSSRQMQQAEAALRKGDLSEAKKLLLELVEPPAEISSQYDQALVHYRLGKISGEQVKYAEALDHLEHAAQLAPDNALYANANGFLFKKLGNYDKAIQYYGKSVRNLKKTHSADHPLIAMAWNKLGEAWRDKGNLNQAIEFFDKSLTSNIKNYGEDHPRIAANLNNLGITWEKKGNYDKAIQYYQRALASDLKTYDQDHPKLAIQWNHLGEVWAKKQKYDKAIEYFEKALAVNLKTYGEKHPRVATSWNNLGTAWQDKGNYKNAIDYYEKALASDLKNFGEEHPNVAADWNNLGSAWGAQQNFDKAIEYLEKALNSDLNTYGKDHPNLAARWNHLGVAWSSKGDQDKAIEFYEKAMEIDQTTYGKSHPKMGFHWSALAGAWYMKGNSKIATEYFENALAIFKTAFGKDHPNVLAIQKNLEHIRRQKPNPKE